MARSDGADLALRRFASSVARKMSALALGEPEDQLRAPAERLLADVGVAMGYDVVAKGESLLPGRLGRPDYAVLVDGLLAGYLELKEPGKGADPARFTGHDKQQWRRFRLLPNLLYCDGNQWALYRQGTLASPIAVLSGDIARSGEKAVGPLDHQSIASMLRAFFSWEPAVPSSPEALAELLAPLCRMLREEVTDSLQQGSSPLMQLAADWRQLLFPDADDARFADAYAQTVTFALLLARAEGATTLDLTQPVKALAADHTLLSRALQVLTDPQVRREVGPALLLLQRVIDRVPPGAMSAADSKDPWLYFYEDFLAAYDPRLRRDAGAYYTPIEVVHAQVRLVESLLVGRLGKPRGFADNSVLTLDPGVGTGTYLLGVLEQALRRTRSEEGDGAVPGRATDLGLRLFGFENLVGPYAVAELRLSRALADRGASLPEQGVGVYLTDTLESPFAAPPQVPLILQPLAEQHRRALHVKDEVPIIVCLGNPPYDRHEAAHPGDPTSRARTGGWIRWGPKGDGTGAVLADFIEPAVSSGHGVDVKNLYNLYVYFWRWALWKTFEHSSTGSSGIVSFISAASYLDGNAFVGMREHMRRLADEVWIIDLGGEGRGTRKTENIFAIRTPVSIAIALRQSTPNPAEPAVVRYTRIDGSRSAKLKLLDSLEDLDDLHWQECPTAWHSPFLPAGVGDYFHMPLLTDLFPWQHTGSELKRTWPIAPDRGTLERRWQALLQASDRAEAFKETRDRKIAGVYKPLLADQPPDRAISKLPGDTPAPLVTRYSYRSFDRQWVIADSRVGDFMRPVLWRVHTDRQIYLTTLINHPLGAGPAVTACAFPPDRHHFRGSYGGKEVIPLYRDRACQRPNLTPGLLGLLSEAYSSDVDPEGFLAYVYALLCHPAFTTAYRDELATRDLRVPLTSDPSLFREAREIGSRLLWLHTYGLRFHGEGRSRNHIPRGHARCIRPIPDATELYPESFCYEPDRRQLLVASGLVEPVPPEVWEYEVSGLRVVSAWLATRMRAGAGRRSSPLDLIRPERWSGDMTSELLELLWVLEHTVEIHSSQAHLTEAVVHGDLIGADDLPVAPGSARKPPQEVSLPVDDVDPMP